MNEELSIAGVTAAVVAWHNRHPLARRVSAAQVHTVGYVALPYAVQGGAGEAMAAAVTAPAAGSLRERAIARSREPAGEDATFDATPADRAAASADGVRAAAPSAAAAAAVTPALQPAFSEDFIAPLTPPQVARWAQQHGRALAQAPSDGPVRAVAATPLPPGTRQTTLFVLTAAIDAGGRRSRVLVGAADAPAVLGRRLWSRARMGATAAASAALAAVFVLRPGDRGGEAPAVAAAASAPASAARAVPGVTGAASGREPARAAPSASSPAPVPPEAAPAQAASAPPPNAEPTPRAPARPTSPLAVAAALPRLGRVVAPGAAPLGTLSDEVKARARADVLAARAAAGLPSQAAQPAPAGAEHAASVDRTDPPRRVSPMPAPAQHPQPPPVPASRPEQAAPAAADEPQRPTPPASAAAAHYAVSTRALRTRTEAEQVRFAMEALLRRAQRSRPDAASADAPVPQPRVEVLPQGDDWRVVGWPYARRADAEQARALLTGRGLKVEVVGF